MSVRRRIVLLCVLLAVLGGPWAQDARLDLYEDLYDNAFARWLLDALFLVSWDTADDSLLGTEYVVVTGLSAALLLALFAFLALRFTGRGTTGWARALAVGLLAGQLGGFVRWVLLSSFTVALEMEFWPEGALRGLLRGAALDFGLLAGILLALLTAGLPRPTAAAATLRRPIRKGSVGMTTPQPHMPVGREPGDVTRYLCAAAHVDEDFAERIVEEVVADEASAAAPSPDVDLVAVAHHSLAAQEIRYARDLRLTAACGAVLLCAPLWVVLPAALVAVASAAGRSRPSLATRGSRPPTRRALTGAALGAAVAVFCAFLVAFTLGRLGLSGFPAWLFGGYGGGLPALLIALAATAYAYVIVVQHDIATDRRLRAGMTRERFYRLPLPPLPPRPWIADRMAALREARDGNVTVYSGYTPFKGYARTDSTWSLAVPLLPADEPPGGTSGGTPGRTPGAADEPRPFAVTELIDHVREQLRGVAARSEGGEGGGDEGPRGGGDEGRVAGESLSSLTIEDRVFVAGTSVADDSRFIQPDRLTPTARLTPEAVEQIMLHPTGAVRHYLAVHVPLWGGDVVPSVFLHFSTAGRTLHLHCDNHVLSPVAARYHLVDRLRGPLSRDDERGLLLAALPRTGRALYRAPRAALRHLRFEHRHNRRMLDELTAMEQDPVYDFGARVSVRELGLSPEYHNYFQVVDATRIVATVQRHTLAAIRAFLDARGYDTTDFRSQQQTILNQGLIQQGGTSIIGNQAIGAGATATQQVGRQAGPARGTAGAGAGSGTSGAGE
ncbi:hypothetical protein ABZX40_34915 [Streptomyces sp. NPDC004610]|uniref:hypothetical protein n=1 Tax=unclassified Streptomyces TaxID=2593676 RepID=UPI0033A293D2